MNQLTSIFSAESGDSLLPLDGLDSERLDSVTTNHTHKQSSKSIGQKFQSTETSNHSMARHTEESLFSQVDFPVSLFPMPGSGEARTMTAISGQKCSESYKRQGQLGSLVRMLLASSAWHSTKCFLIWKRVDMKLSRSLFQLAVSMPRIEETEFGLLRGGGAMWPTPRTPSGGPDNSAKRLRPSGHRGTTNLLGSVLANANSERIFPAKIPRDNEKDEKKSNDKFARGCSPAYGRQGLQTNWATEPGLGRVAHGISNRVDRLKGLGNAIVPQVAYEILKAIRSI